MADRLEQHLVKIEQELGGDGSLPKNYNQVDKLDWHLTKIEDLIEEGGGGTTVVANPEMSGDEDDLVGLQVGETKYKVEQPTEVVANPTLVGTEVVLEGLQVGNTKYKVGDEGGKKHLWMFEARKNQDDLKVFQCYFFTNDETNFTNNAPAFHQQMYIEAYYGNLPISTGGVLTNGTNLIFPLRLSSRGDWDTANDTIAFYCQIVDITTGTITRTTELGFNLFNIIKLY